MITEEQLQDLERCDEYSLRHYLTEISELVEAYRSLPGLLEALTEAQGVFQVLADEGRSSTARELADKYAAVLAKARGL